MKKLILLYIFLLIFIASCNLKKIYLHNNENEIVPHIALTDAAQSDPLQEQNITDSNSEYTICDGDRCWIKNKNDVDKDGSSLKNNEENSNNQSKPDSATDVFIGSISNIDDRSIEDVVGVPICSICPAAEVINSQKVNNISSSIDNGLNVPHIKEIKIKKKLTIFIMFITLLSISIYANVQLKKI